MLALLLALAANPADASSDILFRATTPVLIFVDGRQAAFTGNLKMRARDLEPGAHEVRVQGVFGKTLYLGEIEVEDGTVTHADWIDGALEIRGADPMRRRAAEPIAEEDGGDEEEMDEVAEEAPVVEEILDPVAEADDDLPLAVPLDEPVPEPPAPEPVAAPKESGVLKIQAQPGVRIEVVGAEGTLYLSVEDGVFTVSDGAGVEIRFGE